MSTEPSSEDRVRRHVILILLWTLAGVSAFRVALADGTGLVDSPICAGVDPNRAPWWDLTLLPEIGPTTARAIVTLRDDATLPNTEGASPSSAFVRPVDLTRVKGIGPRTIERCGRHLRFGRVTTSDGARTGSTGSGQ